MSPRLSSRDWVDAALRTLVEQGIDALRVERLAAAMGVTKGSFYWHFKDQKALLAAVLTAWEARATSDIIFNVEAQGGDARARLRALAIIVFGSDGVLERQVRAWAARDPAAAEVQDRVDERRIGYVSGLFEAAGFTPEHAQARAVFVYQALIGQFALGQHSALRPDQVELIVDVLIGDRSSS